MRELALAALALLLGLAPAPAPAEVRIARVDLVDALPPGRSVEDRLDEIRRRIQDALVYPPLARSTGQEGVVRIRFEIDPGGRPQELQTSPSGRWLLDRAAERAVRDAAPLPYVWGRLEVPVHFELER